MAMRSVRKGLRVPWWLSAPLMAGAYLYVAVLLGWFVARLFFGDRWWWLFLINTLAVYLFLPLPLLLLASLLIKRLDLWLGFGAVFLLGFWLYGGLFLPHLTRVQAHQKTLVAMTYNLLLFNTNISGVVSSLRASNADVIALQELNGTLAEAIQHQLHDEYPYQVIDPQHNSNGMGLISRYPLHQTNLSLPGNWLGTPQILTLDFGGTPVTLINLHNVSLRLGLDDWRANLEQSSRERERQAQQVVNFAATHLGPLLVFGDFNTTDLSTAHGILTSKLHDSWREGGYGLGLTFPGGKSDRGAGISFKGIKVPTWLVRIDYIFHSDDLRTVSARIGQWDGQSDHRPVIAELALRK